MWRILVLCSCAALTLLAATWSGDVGILKTHAATALSEGCPGDFNGDGKVNLADFLAFAGGFGARSGDANYVSVMDLDGDGAIELSDFLAFAGVFGTTCEDRPRGSVNGDRAALVALYNATDGPNWFNNDNWLTDAPLGEWYGVETDGSGRVTELRLHGRFKYSTGELVRHGLRGRIPPEIGHLTNLQKLEMYGNSLSGPIPSELGNLAELRVLVLHSNELSGTMPPDLGRLGQLTYLDLSFNYLEGGIPSELGRLVQLTNLELNSNPMGGRIPSALGNLTKLDLLRLENCLLRGPIPPELGNLSNLVDLKMRKSGNWGNCGYLTLTETGFQARFLRNWVNWPV